MDPRAYLTLRDACMRKAKAYTGHVFYEVGGRSIVTWNEMRCGTGVKIHNITSLCRTDIEKIHQGLGPVASINVTYKGN